MAWIRYGDSSRIFLMVWAPLVPAGLVTPTDFFLRRIMCQVWAFETGDAAPTVTIAEARGGQVIAAAVDDRRGVRRCARERSKSCPSVLLV